MKPSEQGDKTLRVKENTKDTFDVALLETAAKLKHALTQDGFIRILLSIFQQHTLTVEEIQHLREEIAVAK